MSKESKEKELRKNGVQPVGTWVRMGDGELWCVSSLPLGKNREEILTKFEKLLDASLPAQPGSDLAEHRRIMFDASYDFCLSLLHVNYPALNEDYAMENDLVSMGHVKPFLQIFQGERELGEIVGNVSGEAETPGMVDRRKK